MIKKLVLVFLAVFIILAGAGAVLYFGGFLRAPEIEAVRMNWGEVTSQETQVLGEVQVNNRMPVGLGSREARLEVGGAFYGVPVFSLILPQLRLDQGRSTLSVDGSLRQVDLPRWWPQFIENDETLAIRVEPRVQARALGRQISRTLPRIETQTQVPLLANMASDEARTLGFNTASPLAVGAGPGEHFVSHPPDPPPDFPLLTVVSWELHWGTATEAATQILGTMVVRNETAAPLPVQGLGLGLDMNGIQVVPDARLTPDSPALPPGQEVPLRMDVMADNHRLVEWWTSHIQQGEETAVTARIGLTIVLPSALLGGVGQDVQLPLVPVPGFRCILRTDIMGMANYEVARAIGTEAGPRPESHRIECPPPPAPIIGEMAGIAPGTESPPVPGTDILPPAPLPPTPTLPIVETAPSTSAPAATYSLKAEATPAAGGRVVLAPSQGTYSAGTEVSLTAVPALGYAFDRWSGDATGSSPGATIFMNADQDVVAHFRRLLP